MTPQEQFRQQAPAPLPPRSIQLPSAVETKLKNGLSVIVVPDHHLPLVSYRLAFRSGDANDPSGLPGLTDLLTGLLSEGTDRIQALRNRRPGRKDGRHVKCRREFRLHNSCGFIADRFSGRHPRFALGRNCSILRFPRMRSNSSKKTLGRAFVSSARNLVFRERDGVPRNLWRSPLLDHRSNSGVTRSNESRQTRRVSSFAIRTQQCSAGSGRRRRRGPAI